MFEAERATNSALRRLADSWLFFFCNFFRDSETPRMSSRTKRHQTENLGKGLKKARTSQSTKIISLSTRSPSSSRLSSGAASSSSSSSSSTTTQTSILSCFHKSKKITLPSIGLVSSSHAKAPPIRIGPKELIPQVFLASETDLIHYSCLGEADVGWGCAYRCLQMILSNLFLFDGRNDEPTDESQDPRGAARWSAMPNLRSIQVQLFKLKRLKKRDIGGTTWIEPPDVGCYLRSFGLAADDVIFRPGKNEEAFKERLIRHFEVEGTPVMIDDRVKAYCILGVRLDVPAKRKAESEMEVRSSAARVTHLLRFDPHVTQYRVPDRISGAKWLTFKAAFYSSEWLVLFPHRPSVSQCQVLRAEHEKNSSD